MTHTCGNKMWVRFKLTYPANDDDNIDDGGDVNIIMRKIIKNIGDHKKLCMHAICLSLSLNHTQLSVIANDVIRKMKCGKWEFFDMLRLFLEGLAVCNFLLFLSIYICRWEIQIYFLFSRVCTFVKRFSYFFFVMIRFDIKAKNWWDKNKFRAHQKLSLFYRISMEKLLFFLKLIGLEKCKDYLIYDIYLFI